MLSYSRGPAHALWEKTIGQVLDQTVERWGDCLALVSRHSSKRYSWRELRELADSVARGLWSLGIRPGDRVGLWSTNCVEWVMLQLGCARAGAILVNVNPAYRTHELAFTLRKSRMKALFLWERDSHAEYAQILEEARHGQTLPLEHVVFSERRHGKSFCAQNPKIVPRSSLSQSSPKTSPIFSTPREPPACRRECC